MMAARNKDIITAMWFLFLALLTTSPTHYADAQGPVCPRVCLSCAGGVADCSDQSLTAPPKDYPSGTRILNLENNYIRVLGMRTFNPLPSLEVLKVSGNTINALRNDAFMNFPNLQTLDLTNNRIFRIYRRSLRNMPSLRTLTLNRNKIRTLARIFEALPRLYQLNLAKNRIRSIGESDFTLVNRLHYIDLRDNVIQSIHPNAFKELTRLRYLFLNNNPLVSLPPMVWGSAVLQQMDLSKCKLTAVPQPLPASLGDLRLGHNHIRQIQHTDFLNITDLQMLTLSDNGIEFLADGTFSHLTQLRELWLRGNQLVYIPRELPDNLRTLHMGLNSLRDIEQNLFSPNSRLSYLSVESNKLERVGEGTFSGLRFLVSLNLQGNQIQTLEPRSFSDLGSLSTLLLSNNPLKRIEPQAFHQLGNLTTLYMHHLTEENFEMTQTFLPQMLRLRDLGLMNSPGLAQKLMDLVADPQISRDVMSHMTKLDLSYNTLETVSPEARRVFPNVETLALDGNPLRCDRRLRWLGDWMNSNPSLKFFQFEEPRCENPSRLRGVLVKNVATNDWATEGEADTSGRGYHSGRHGLARLQADMARASPYPMAMMAGPEHPTSLRQRDAWARGVATEKQLAARKKASAARRKEIAAKTKEQKEKKKAMKSKKGKGKKDKKKRKKGKGKKGRKNQKKAKKGDRKKNKDRRRRKDKRTKPKGKRTKRDTEIQMMDADILQELV